MKSEKLLELIGKMDDGLVEEALCRPVTQRPWARWAVVAASAAAVVLLVLVAGRVFSPASPGVPITAVSGGDIAGISGTSETYQSLDQLLSHLSRHDNHSADSLSEGGSKGGLSGIDGSGCVEGSNAVVVNGHICHSGDEGIVISRPEGDGAAKVCTLEIFGARLFALGDRLAAVCQTDISSPDDPLDYQLNVHIYVYDLSRPEEPQLVMLTSQSGSYQGAFLSSGMLWILSSDGECACGYSRLEDKSGYIPTVTVDGQPVPLTDEQLHILGEPTMVRYLAVCGISLDGTVLEETQALYGDISNVFFGDGYLALETSTFDGRRVSQPDVYLFDIGGTISYKGKISTAAILDIPSAVNPSAESAQSFELVSFSTDEERYRMTGTLHTHSGDFGSTRIAAIEISRGLDCCSAALSETISGAVTITETVDEPNRQIICYSTFGDDFTMSGHFAFALYDDNLSVVTPAGNINHMDGIDMIFSYGSPYGQFSTIVPMGEVYLRFEGSPDRIQAYDLSDPLHPAPVGGVSLALEDIQRFCYLSHIYEDGRIGFIVLTPGLDEEGEYNYRQRYLTCEYVVCEYDPDTCRLSPISRFTVGGYQELAVVECGGRMYCVTDGADVPVLID